MISERLIRPYMLSPVSESHISRLLSVARNGWAYDMDIYSSTNACQSGIWLHSVRVLLFSQRLLVTSAFSSIVTTERIIHRDFADEQLRVRVSPHIGPRIGCRSDRFGSVVNGI